MDPFHFTCPHCAAGLKTRDRLSVGRQVSCPDCGLPFRIVQGKAGLATEKVETAPPVVPQPTFRERLASQLRSNRSLIAATLILGCVLVLAAVMATRWRRTDPETASIAPAPTPDAKPPGDKGEPPKAEPAKLPEVELRLKSLGDVLGSRLKAEKAFLSGGHRAAGFPEEEWLGWQAAIVDAFPPQANIPVVRDRSWRDPLNEAFVRRRIEAFQNPAVAALTGDDGYPASHFAGIAGVGEEAARLPKSDARAGIFGYDRRTKAEDVRDGLANTILVAGVHEQLGSWASAAATVRGLTRPPYVNGPDGFGTGDGDAMFVLMADGRVVSLSAKTDPEVLRKMAAMADEAESRQPPVPEVAANGPDDQPIEPLHSNEDEVPPELEAPRPPPVKTVAEIEASLDREVLAYTFPPKTAVRLSVLKEVAELTGVPLTFDAPDLGPLAARLDEPLGEVRAAVLKDTSARKVLIALLDPLDLTFHVEPGRLRLVRKP